MPPVRDGPQDLTIRRLREDDWPAFRRLRLRALRSDPMAFGSTYDKEAQFPDERWKAWARQGAAPVGSATWVAVRADGEFAGMVVAVARDGQLHLFSMWVEPSVRASGIGSRLLDAALTWAGTLPGRPPVRLEVNPRQEPAVRLYVSRGFRFTGTVRPLEHTPGETVHEMERGPGEGTPTGPEVGESVPRQTRVGPVGPRAGQGD